MLLKSYMDPAYSVEERYCSDLVKSFLSKAFSDKISQKSLDFSYQGKTYSLQSDEQCIGLYLIGGGGFVAFRRGRSFRLPNGQELDYRQLQDKVLGIIFPQPRPKPVRKKNGKKCWELFFSQLLDR